MTAPKAILHVTEHVIQQFQDYYDKPGNGAGGSLHIVFDDYNVDDDSVRFCITHAIEKNDQNGVKLARLLLQMSKSQRLKIGRSVG